MNLFRRLQPVAARGALPVVARRAAGDLVGAEVRRRAAALARKTAFDIDRPESGRSTRRTSAQQALRQTVGRASPTDAFAWD